MASQGAILVGTIGQGVMRSADDGATWARGSVRQGMHSDCIVRALRGDPHIPQVVYAGTDMGLYRSDDGGAKWSLLDTPMTGSTVTAIYERERCIGTVNQKSARPTLMWLNRLR